MTGTTTVQSGETKSGTERPARRRTHIALRVLAVTAISLTLTGCILRFFSGLVIVDDLGTFIDLIFNDVNAAYCRDVRDFDTGTTSVECMYHVVTEDGFSERTSTAQLLSEFGVFGVIVDPVILQVPDIAVVASATVDDGTGPQPLVITETTSFQASPVQQVFAETGHKFWIIDLPPAIEAVLPDGPLQTAPQFDYRFAYRLPGVYSTLPVNVKAMYAGRVEAGGQTYYFPMLPCTTDFGQVPELRLPVGVPLNGLIFDVLNLFLNPANPACDNQVYDFTSIGGNPPAVTLRKQVSLDDSNYFDADLPGAADVPVGVVGATNATYRLVIENTGGETLTDVLVEDPSLGISATLANLAQSETRVIESSDAGFGSLSQPQRCTVPGNKTNIATVSAVGQASGGAVGDDDAANVRCVAGPEIELFKQVSLDGANFLDADMPAAGPTGLLGADARYRLIVRNLGDEDLTGLSIDDPALGMASVPLPDLPVGAEVVIDVGSFGAFGELFVANRCDTAGIKLNMAQVSAVGRLTGTPVDGLDAANVTCEDARIEFLKQVSLDGVNFFDADQPGDPDVPVGIVGQTNARYRLIVQNDGSEALTNVQIEDPMLGISAAIADLVPGETRVIEAGDTGFGNLVAPSRCGGLPGIRSNIASVSATGGISGVPVSTDDAANVRCITGAQIELLKQVKLGGTNFVDADTPAAAPSGPIGADATYRLIVRNTGDEDLTTIRISDSTAGIVDELIPDLPVAAEAVIDAGSFGKFNELFVPNRCDSTGTRLNIATVDAIAGVTGMPVSDDNPAYVQCVAGACVDDLAARAKRGKIQLTWSHSGASGYDVSRSQTAGGPYTLIGNTDSTYATYLDTGVTNGITYFYVVQPLDSAGNVLCSANEASATSGGRRRR